MSQMINFRADDALDARINEDVSRAPSQSQSEDLEDVYLADQDCSQDFVKARFATARFIRFMDVGKGHMLVRIGAQQ